MTRYMLRAFSTSQLALVLLLLSSSAARSQEEPLRSDRPDFTESSSTVGRGRVQLEGGYTFTHDSEAGIETDEHVLPELLLRAGLSDTVEFRLSWEGWIQSRIEDGAIRDRVEGTADLEVGVKIEITEQCDCCLRPETAVIVSTTVPSGEEFGSEEVQPLVNFLYSWELNECLSLAGSTGLAALDEDDDDFLEISQSLSLSRSLNDDVGAYFEWYSLMRHSAEVGPEHYLNGGFTFLLNPNFQLDVRAGFGLNDQADDFFAGTGFAKRW